MSEYISSIKKWCEEILETYQASITELREHAGIQPLDDWKEQFTRFQEELSTNESLQESDVQERANELFAALQSFFNSEREEVSLESEDRVESVPIGGHTLPPLPYRYDALEPYIAEEIMRLHHDKHHRSYVEGLNKAEREMQRARQTNNFELIKHWEREAAFHGAGHYLHTIFWNIMSPRGGGQPTGSLLRAINQSFGSFDQFKKHFSEAAKNVEAVGWAILVWSPRSRRLEILQAEKHQNLSQWDVVPLLVLDVWEHAYYLQYKNEREKYVDNWWNVVNWREVDRRFQQARQLKWEPF
ncbi:superoxide dismutase [Oceanobacillus saliphilus]|uniref:superoxide dismutase n=1 Tax=Oceanobacillus saliphilus TaxID=2925834 RepID=UPI00201DEC47|nr:superoxide dismutase [Oceanobacillus saliphilus]